MDTEVAQRRVVCNLRKKIQLPLQNFSKDGILSFLSLLEAQSGGMLPHPRATGLCGSGVTMFARQSRAVPWLPSPLRLCCNQGRDECVTSATETSSVPWWHGPGAAQGAGDNAS